jgi:parvulin-like peptidyl-prolyl isomerase
LSVILVNLMTDLLRVPHLLCSTTASTVSACLRGYRRASAKDTKQKVIGLSLVLLVLIGFASISRAELAEDRIAAAVNGDVILESDIQRQKQPVMQQLMNLPLGVVPPGKWPTEKEILDELIDMHLLEQEAAKKGIRIDDAHLDATIKAIRDRQHLSYDQFVAFLSSNGLTLPEYRKVMRRQFTLAKLIRMEVLQKILLNEEDAIKYYKQNKDKIEEKYQELIAGRTPAAPPNEAKLPEIPTHAQVYVGGRVRLRQITLKLPSSGKRKDAAAVLNKAKLIYREANTGADFANLAKTYSNGPDASSGGDLGWMNYKDMVPGLRKLVQRLKKGDVSPPLKTPNGIIIFYLADARNRTTKEVPIPERELREIKKQLKALKEHREKLQKEAAEKQRAKQSQSEEVDSEHKPKIPPGLLSPEEEKDYLKVRGKVIELLKYEKIQNRMKEWIKELKKNAIIDVKL